MSDWINHVKKTQNENNCSYKEALTIASQTYRKQTGRGGRFTKLSNAQIHMAEDLVKIREKRYTEAQKLFIKDKSGQLTSEEFYKIYSNFTDKQKREYKAIKEADLHNIK